MLRGLYRSRCEQIGGIASAVRGLALDEVVDLILLAHEDEFVVAMHDQFLGAVLELLAWGLEAHHGHAVLVMYLYVLDAAAYRVQGRVDLGNMGRTLWQALFYAVSAYNNTGFTPDATGLHVNRWGVGLPILISAFIGTLGFPVVLNLVQCARRRLSPKRWTLHTKLTLVTTAVLVATSLAWFLLVEWSNTGLFPADDPGMKMRRAMSAAVMPRSAGFDISWVPEVTNETKVFMSILMFIGAGSSSTAGGIRVTTFAVILLICRAAFTGHRDVTVFRRRIPRRIQMTAVSVTTACFALVMVGAMMLMFTTGCAFVDAVFEACSAFSLGGYSVGVASAGNPASLFILSAEMIVGRLGPLTIAYSISRPMAPEPIRYPQENIIVG